MTLLTKVAAFAFIFAATQLLDAQGSPPQPIKTTVCHVVAGCRQFNGKRLLFRASVISDGFEYTALVDPNCKTGISPFTSADVDEHEDIKAFDDALSKGRPGTRDKDIEATFIGTFECNLNASSIVRRRVLHIEEIKDLKVTPKSPS
jgi:hypothetical protein